MTNHPRFKDPGLDVSKVFHLTSIAPGSPNRLQRRAGAIPMMVTKHLFPSEFGNQKRIGLFLIDFRIEVQTMSYLSDNRSARWDHNLSFET